MIETFLTEVLDAIEQKEARLLVWGLTDGRLTRDELGDLIDPLLDRTLEEGLSELIDAEDVINALKDRGLLFDTDAFPYQGYRSRMAETVRLLFRLRQLFPKHEPPDGWQQARTLVDDYRFLLRKRHYPKRQVAIEEALERVHAVITDTDTKKAIESLLKKRQSSFKLADFQLRATNRILENLETRRETGTLVSAGTGSGKTLAFYLPAIARVTTRLTQEASNSYWVKILAIYPRTELLRDQFTEIYNEARQLDKFLIERRSRKIRIGALFGATPQNAEALQRWTYAGWQRSENGYVCGFMACPETGCGGDLVWRRHDLRQKREILVCSSCNHTVCEDEVVLTRASMEKHPPDVLFTTTEMLNQKLSDSTSRHLFGLRPGTIQAPEVVLLDEVHTYSGTHGAQVGYLLRRWRHLVRAPVSFVGLSATLREGKAFFARLTGLQEHQVEEISPRLDEMAAEGAEYMIVLRGDPVSRATLLATTIQTVMLLSRMLDRKDGLPSNGVYGQRIFAFTDDIDVTNRLYFDLLDAEGRNDRGEPDHKRHLDGGLAVLRRPMPSEARDRYGQNWDAPLSLGHRLEDRKEIGRTSSQDPGVSADKDVIVATASLEVGFNDSGVGAVVQHKAPRESAQFLQRKGRAGRPREMRPWTVVVLSDYGRDRLAYRAYEQLFDPELAVRHLPFSSRYIQRIQSVYALIDYLGICQSPNLPQGSVWTDLAGPVRRKSTEDRKRPNALVKHLTEMLENPQATDDLQEHIQQALGLSQSETRPLLWEYPRPLLTTVVPTAIRRLATNWRSNGNEMSDFNIKNSPLPEFAPCNLFSDLNLPEVKIVLPPARPGDKSDTQMMPIVQALRTYAPGRVSRRFGIKRRWIRHWIADGPPSAGNQQISLNSFCNATGLGHWKVRDGEGANTIAVYRPFEIRPSLPPTEVGDTSNAQLEWRTQIMISRRGLIQHPPESTVWKGLIDIVEAFTHAEHSQAEVRRFAIGSVADIRFRGGDSQRTHFTFIEDDKPAALGFSISVDALRFRLSLPSGLWADVDTSTPKGRALRTKRFFDTAWSGEGMEFIKNPFVRQWLAVIYFTALTHDALKRGISLSEASASLADNTASIVPNQVLETLFHSPTIPDDSDNGDASGERGEDRLRQELDGLLGRTDVLNALRNLATLLWEPIDKSWESWLRLNFTSTIAATVFDAIQNYCPEIEAEGLVVDIDVGPRGGVNALTDDANYDEFWISETTPGGNGSIEAFLNIYADDPRHFYTLLSGVLRPNEYELIDQQLGRLLHQLVGPEPVDELVETIKAFRVAGGAAESESAFATLRHHLSKHEFVIFHGFLSALTNRVLRSGATVDSDLFLLRARNLWLSEEERLGVELDGRTVAYRLSQDGAIDKVMSAAGLSAPKENLLTWRFNVIYGLLWNRGSDVRKAGLGSYNPFDSLPDAEPLLVTSYLGQHAEQLSLDEDDWQELALNQLAKSGSVTLVCPLHEGKRLAEALRFFATNPVESDYLSVYARIYALRRVHDYFEADIEIEEVLG